jgi:glucose dehydrogenase
LSQRPAPPGQTPSTVRRGSRASPLVVDGMLYMPTPYGRVVALEAHTGKELWF